MAAKPETTFISSVHRLIPQVYAEKMANPWRSGTADVWYSGTRGDLWVEYKFIEKIPRSEEIIPDCSPLQRRWLANRLAEGRNIAVVLGTRTGGVIYQNGDWNFPSSQEQLIVRLVSRKDIADWIFNTVGEKMDVIL